MAENADITIVNPEAVAIETDDGGMIIDFDPNADTQVEFNANLSEFIDERDLQNLANELIGAFESDKDSRADWERTYIEGLDNLGLKIEERAEPWAGACGVYHPMLSEAVIRFQAQTIQSVGWKIGQVGFSELGSSTRLGYADSVELSSVRLSRLLDSVGFPSSLRDINTGTLNVQQQALTSNLLTAMRECETAENAQFFIAKDGKATFRNRDYKLSNTKAINVQATFDNSGSNLPYQDVVTSFDTDEVKNVYEWTRTSGSPQYVADADSVSRYTAKTSTKSTINTSDANVLSIIQQKLSETSLPIERIDSLKINPRDNTSLWEKVLGLEFGDRVKVNITNPNGSTFSDEVWIQSIRHSINSGSQTWNYTVSLSPAGSSGWVLGQAKIGEGTRFAYT